MILLSMSISLNMHSGISEEHFNGKPIIKVYLHKFLKNHNFQSNVIPFIQRANPDSHFHRCHSMKNNKTFATVHKFLSKLHFHITSNVAPADIILYSLLHHNTVLPCFGKLAPPIGEFPVFKWREKRGHRQAPYL